jgi:diguanylate cyclase (GGDEF)-like protein
MTSDRPAMQPDSEEIAAFLRQPWYRAKLSPRLRSWCESETAPSRCSRLRFALLLIAGIHLLLLVLPDRQLGPSQMLRGLETRVGLILPLSLLGTALLQSRFPIWVQAAAGIIPVVATTAVDSWLGMHAGAMADRYFMSLGMGLFFNNLVMPLRIRHAAVATLASLAIYSSVLSNVFGPVPIALRRELALNIAAFVLFSLGMRWRDEMRQRKAVMLGLQNRIQMQQLAWANRQLTELSYTDALTRLPNRRFLDELLLRLVNYEQSLKDGIGIIMLDIDHFKGFNDTLGHPMGDRCLQQLAQALQFSVRVEVDTIARFGGEEFIAILPGISAADALLAGERIRLAVANLQIPHPANPNDRYVTVSVGVAFSKGNHIQVPALLQAADQALYRAKAEGRNRVVGDGVPAATETNRVESPAAQ